MQNKFGSLIVFSSNVDNILFDFSKRLDAHFNSIIKIACEDLRYNANCITGKTVYSIKISKRSEQNEKGEENGQSRQSGQNGQNKLIDRYLTYEINRLYTLLTNVFVKHLMLGYSGVIELWKEVYTSLLDEFGKHLPQTLQKEIFPEVTNLTLSDLDKALFPLRYFDHSLDWKCINDEIRTIISITKEDQTVEIKSRNIITPIISALCYSLNCIPIKILCQSCLMTFNNLIETKMKPYLREDLK